MKNLILITILFVNYLFISGQEVDSISLNGNYLQTIKQLQKEKASFKNLVKIGDIYKQVGNYQKAILNYKNALQLKADSNVKQKLASSYAKNNQRENAIKIYRELVTLYPKIYCLNTN
jgi:tetratricopeptide (TPR) repeat protein